MVHVSRKYEYEITISAGGGLEQVKKHVVRVYKIKSFIGVPFRATLDGSETLFFHSLGFSEHSRLQT